MIAGSPAAAPARFVRRLAAHNPPAVAASLAVSDWGVPSAAPLDLRYAPDEAELLDPRPAAIWRACAADARAAEHYPVDDPYGARRGAQRVSAFHGVALDPAQLTFGAGVTGLLRDLAGLGGPAPVLAAELGHPDLEVWALAAGRDIALAGEPLSAAGVIAAIEDVRPGLVHLDRPGFLSTLLGHGDVEAIAHAAAAYGGAVVIDEAAAPYLDAGASAVAIVCRCENLIVLRGFTKAYSLGGLRIGYAVASASVATRVRELVVPMQVAGPSLAAALELLAHPGMLGRLRRRIAASRPAVVEILRAGGLEVFDSRPELPWVIVNDPGGAVDECLLAAGIRSLRPVRVPGAPPPSVQALHLTIPLSPSRLADLRRRVATLAS